MCMENGGGKIVIKKEKEEKEREKKERERKRKKEKPYTSRHATPQTFLKHAVTQKSITLHSTKHITGCSKCYPL